MSWIWKNCSRIKNHSLLMGMLSKKTGLYASQSASLQPDILNWSFGPVDVVTVLITGMCHVPLCSEEHWCFPVGWAKADVQKLFFCHRAGELVIGKVMLEYVRRGTLTLWKSCPANWTQVLIGFVRPQGWHLRWDKYVRNYKKSSYSRLR